MLGEGKGYKRMSVSSLKEELVRKWLGSATSLDVLEINLETAVASSTAPTTAAGSVTMAAASDPTAAGSSAGGASKKGCESAISGLLALCPFLSEDHVDETSAFTNIENGPPLPDVSSADVSMKQLLEEGVDGIVPVASVVKVLQGLQEMDGIQVAVFLSEEAKFMRGTMIRKVVRRVVMGTEDQMIEKMQEERRMFPSMVPFALVHEKNAAIRPDLRDLLELQEACTCTLDPRSLPSDLSKPQTWTVQSFMHVPDHLQAWAMHPTLGLFVEFCRYCFKMFKVSVWIYALFRL